MVGQSLQLSQALCVLSLCRSYLRAVSLQAVINSEQDFSVFQSHLEHCWCYSNSDAGDNQ